VKELVAVPPTSLSSDGGENDRKEAREEDGGQVKGQERAREDKELESTAQLREAVLTPLASLSLFSKTVRRVVTDELGLLHCLLVILNRGRSSLSLSPSSSSVILPSSSLVTPTKSSANQSLQ